MSAKPMQLRRGGPLWGWTFTVGCPHIQLAESLRVPDDTWLGYTSDALKDLVMSLLKPFRTPLLALLLTWAPLTAEKGTATPLFSEN